MPLKRFLLLLTICMSLPVFGQGPMSPCYWSGSLVQCFPSTGIYLDTQKALRLGDSTTNYVELKSPSAVTTYSLVMPPSQGAVSTYLGNNGSGTLSWSVPPASMAGVITGAHAGDVIIATPAGVFAQDDNFSDQSGLVSIGTTTPATARLTIYESGNRANLQLSTGQSYNPFRIFSTGGGLLFDINTSGSIVTTPLVGVTTGTAANPNFTENSLFRSGMYLLTSDIVGFSTHGSERMRILDNPGNVAIGTTSASQMLTVGTSGQFQVTSAGSAIFTGATAGAVTVAPTASGASWTLTLPGTAGSNGQFLTTNGSGTSSWSTVNLATSASVTGVLLPANMTPASLTSAGTVSNESTGTSTPNFTGPFTVTQNATVKWSRSGSNVILYISQFTAACSVGASITVADTGAPHPSATQIGFASVTDNSTGLTTPGAIYMNTNGTMNILKDASSSGHFTASGNCGLTAIASIAYSVF